MFYEMMRFLIQHNHHVAYDFNELVAALFIMELFIQSDKHSYSVID